jgi:hypothetical protein
MLWRATESRMRSFPRGIAPELLLTQVTHTVPYLDQAELSPLGSGPVGIFPAHTLLKKALRQKELTLSHSEYFKLCVSAHYSTCSTPVPTDVDNQIRHKLWPKGLPLEDALEMTRFVLESRRWDYTLVSTRFVRGIDDSSGNWSREVLSGNLGEWFTVACAAYCALTLHYPGAQEAVQVREHLFQEISDECQRHSDIFASLWKARRGVECLKASALIAHNFGDLDRVMDMWDLSMLDPLRLNFYKLASLPFDSQKNLRYLGRLWVGGQLYSTRIDTSSMAHENHRHFALRKPRCLRNSFDYLIPLGPFFDDWGRQVAQGLLKSGDELGLEDVIRALEGGFKRLPHTFGYARALKAISEVYKTYRFEDLKVREWVKDRAMRKVLELSQEEFEKRWNDAGLLEMDEIPARA